jgi:hypothetical protein
VFHGWAQRAAGRALTLIRPRAESRPETLVRPAIRDVGLPEPDVPVEVRDVRRLDDFAANGRRVVAIVGRSFFADRPGSIGRVGRALTDAGWRA